MDEMYERSKEKPFEEEQLVEDEEEVAVVRESESQKDSENVDEPRENFLEVELDNEPSNRNLFVRDHAEEDDIRKIAETLTQRKKIPHIEVHYEQDTYPLFDTAPLDDDSDIDNYRQSVCRDTTMLQRTFADFMAYLRDFLENRYGKLQFTSQEILLDIRTLDLEVCEDNVYNTQIALGDIVTIFEILQGRSLENNENSIPTHLEMFISKRPRFVSRYNSLVELTESTATLQNIRPFSNDVCHPLVLDDDSESIAMQDAQDHGNDSDELLEILSE